MEEVLHPWSANSMSAESSVDSSNYRKRPLDGAIQESEAKRQQVNLSQASSESSEERAIQEAKHRKAESNLAALILKVGDNEEEVVSHLRGLTEALIIDAPIHYTHIINHIMKNVLCYPQKAAVYATLTGLLMRRCSEQFGKDSSFPKGAEMGHRIMRLAVEMLDRCMVDGIWWQTIALIKFISELVHCRVIHPQNMSNILRQIVDDVVSPYNSSNRRDAYCFMALSSIELVGLEMQKFHTQMELEGKPNLESDSEQQHRPVDFPSLMSDLSYYIGNRISKEQDRTLLKLRDAWQKVQQLHDGDWQMCLEIIATRPCKDTRLEQMMPTPQPHPVMILKRVKARGLALALDKQEAQKAIRNSVDKKGPARPNEDNVDQTGEQNHPGPEVHKTHKDSVEQTEVQKASQENGDEKEVQKTMTNDVVEMEEISNLYVQRMYNVKRDDMKGVYRLWTELTQLVSKPNDKAHLVALSVCGFEGDINMASEVWDKLVADGALPKVELWNSLLNVYVQAKDGGLFSKYEEMTHQGSKPDMDTAYVLWAGGHLADPTKYPSVGDFIVQEMKAHNLIPDEQFLEHAINCCQSDVTKCAKTWDSLMSNFHLQPDTNTYIAVENIFQAATAKYALGHKKAKEDAKRKAGTKQEGGMYADKEEQDMIKEEGEREREGKQWNSSYAFTPVTSARTMRTIHTQTKTQPHTEEVKVECYIHSAMRLETCLTSYYSKQTERSYWVCKPHRKCKGRQERLDELPWDILEKVMRTSH